MRHTRHIAAGAALALLTVCFATHSGAQTRYTPQEGTSRSIGDPGVAANPSGGQIMGHDGALNRRIHTSAAGDINVVGLGGGAVHNDLVEWGSVVITPGAALADGIANPTVGIVGGALLGWNGVTWDRLTTDATYGLDVDVTDLPPPWVLADGLANPTVSGIGAFPHWWNGLTWDRAPGDAGEGLDTDASELPDAAALADADANPTTTRVGANLLIWNGVTWDRAPGDAAEGIDTDATELPDAAALADADANPTTTRVGAFLALFNGVSWDRWRGDLLGAFVQGPVADGIAVGGNPVRIGAKDGAGLTQDVTVDGDGHLQTDVLTLPGALTGYAEDTAHVSGDVGIESLAVRMDVKASTAGATGDYAAQIQDADGDTYVSDTVVQGSVASLDGKVSAAAALADATANPTIGRVGAHLFVWNGLTWDRTPGTAAAGALTDTEAAAAAALADAAGNPTTTTVGAAGLVWNGVSWDRAPGTAAAGATVNTELPAPAAVADGTANPTTTGAACFPMLWNGLTWDRWPGAAALGADVNVTALPGGLTGHPEDGAHVSGDVGDFLLAVRNDGGAALCGAGDYCPIGTDNDGNIWTHVALAPGQAADGALGLPGVVHVVGGWDGANVQALSTNVDGELGINDGGNAISVDFGGDVPDVDALAAGLNIHNKSALVCASQVYGRAAAGSVTEVTASSSAGSADNYDGNTGLNAISIVAARVDDNTVSHVYQDGASNALRVSLYAMDLAAGDTPVEIDPTFGLMVGSGQLPPSLGGSPAAQSLSTTFADEDDFVYNEDTGHTTADPGAAVWCVRNDADVVLTTTDLDYSPMSCDSTGRQKIVVATEPGQAANGAALPAVVNAVGGYDGTNLRVQNFSDLDSGAGTYYAPYVALGFAAAGGPNAAGTASYPLVMQGSYADGTAVSKFAVLAGGRDTAGNVRTIYTDTTGRQQVVGAAADGAAAAGNPNLCAGVDGSGNAQSFYTDTTGRPNVVGAGADGAAVAGNPVLMAGTDGANAQTLATDTLGDLLVAGPTLSGYTFTGNPLPTGARAASTNPAAVDDGDAVALMADTQGRAVTIGAPRALTSYGYGAMNNTTADVELLPAPGASTCWTLVSVFCSNDSTTDSTVTIAKHAACDDTWADPADVIFKGRVYQNGGGFAVPIPQTGLPITTANDAVCMDASAACAGGNANCYCTAVGFKVPC